VVQQVWNEICREVAQKAQGYGDTFFIDEVFVKIDDKQHYLWRAVDQDGEIVDVFLQERRDAKAAKRRNLISNIGAFYFLAAHFSIPANGCSWPTTEKKSTKTTLDSVPLTGSKLT